MANSPQSRRPTPVRPTDRPPRILSNSPHDERTMHVSYRFADGRQAVVAVRKARWHAGGHSGVGQAIARTLAGLDLQADAIGGSLPE